MNDVVSAIVRSDTLRAVAVIVRQDGPAYRPLGAMMVIYDDLSFDGHISSGCIEADIIAHCRELDAAKILQYGTGSPFADLHLPCGGTMDVLLTPLPDKTRFQEIEAALACRTTAALGISTLNGEITPSDAEATKRINDTLHIHFEPPLHFCVYGNGLEAKVFAELTNGAGYDVALFSTAAAILEKCDLPQPSRHLMPRPAIKHPEALDAWTAIVLFFHEHELETQILLDALTTDAFYIGAQGSYSAHQNRLAELERLGASDLERIRGPIGLIQKTRDPQTLAISVLAEIHSVAQQQGLP